MFAKSNVTVRFEFYSGDYEEYYFLGGAVQASSCLLGLLFSPEDGNSTFIRNNGKLLPDYTVSHPKRESSEYQCAYCNIR
jgi:hypothetical protein